ncbi:hypothetical protein HMPREF0580_0286 [Mobiluncus mulieris ATCC 35239]|uniref:Uncharacterized protein n=1 Tax=Mobiluncus mulieris ATCC 35239 TaxID=871571 RepID=E0QN22_9ACTO|nr:hypothetical protein HMPREF0580_0286 [Mobiluncus mulieris ATCC 35239]
MSQALSCWPQNFLVLSQALSCWLQIFLVLSQTGHTKAVELGWKPDI